MVKIEELTKEEIAQRDNLEKLMGVTRVVFPNFEVSPIKGITYYFSITTGKSLPLEVFTRGLDVNIRVFDSDGKAYAEQLAREYEDKIEGLPEVTVKLMYEPSSIR